MPIPQQRAQPIADFSDCAEVQKRLTHAADAISAMAHRVAQARQIKEFENDRRKRALAIWTLPFLKAGDSSAAAETAARAGEGYKTDMTKLAGELVAAEKVLVEYEAMKIQWESARSLLALQRDAMRQL